MSYTALYRTWRPQRFMDVVGQVHVSKTLKNALILDQVAHAYLFCGPRGTGKTSSAKILAKAVNCLNPVDGEPCNECINCEAINTGSFLDCFEIDAASNRGIDEIRDIRDKVKFAPSQGKCKVYIIDEVHMLTSEAFNALLKTLEEPPEHVLFILATTEPQKIPLTILSRCQRFDFRKISTEEIKKHLIQIVEETEIDITDTALLVIARKADGGMRDALSLLDQCIAFAGNKITDSDVEAVLGTLSEEQIINISEALINKEASDVIIYLNEFLQSGKDIKQILRDLLEHFRNIMLLKISQNEDIISLSEAMLPKVKKQANDLNLNYLGNIITKLTEVEKELRWTGQPQILLEASLIDIILRADAVIAPLPKEPLREKEKPKKSKGDSSPQNVNSENVKSDHIKHQNDPKLKEIKKMWPEVLEKIKSKKITTHAFLIMGEPYSLVDGELKIIFGRMYKFHRDKIEQRENKDLVKDTINEVMGIQLNISCILEGENKSQDESSKTSVVDKAIEVFGENIVEVKD